MAVPKNAVGAIIGREGCVVNGIRHASGASVQVLNSDEDAVETLVELRGYPHQLTMVCFHLFIVMLLYTEYMQTQSSLSQNLHVGLCHTIQPTIQGLYFH